MTASTGHCLRLIADLFSFSRNSTVRIRSPKPPDRRKYGRFLVRLFVSFAIFVLIGYIFSILRRDFSGVHRAW